MVFELKGYEFVGLILFCIFIGMGIGVQFFGGEKLSTNQDAWLKCRSEAWDSCKLTEIAELHNSFFDEENYKNLDRIGVCHEASSECWGVKAELCDGKFDMNKIETAKISISKISKTKQ